KPTPRPRPVVTRPPVRRTQAAPRPVAPRLPTCPSVPPVGSATQVVLVTGAGSSATVRACRRDGGRWVSVLGTVYGHVGVHGVAPPGAKREGDGRTPSGSYALGRGFGVQGDPGVVFRWTRVDSHDVWVDDPRSALYNTWQRTPADGRWSSAEPLDQPVAYAYAQVIDYNTARTPGLGSAIFLHVDHGSGTAGCVSVPRAQLLALFRWERPGAVVVIR
ncbi:MAG: L,D-transpeptidase family protein, partial [Mycobacteriales bacterium]